MSVLFFILIGCNFNYYVMVSMIKLLFEKIYYYVLCC